MPQGPDKGAGQQGHQPYEQEIEDRRRRKGLQREDQEGEQTEQKRSESPGEIFPELVDYHSHTVEAAPDDEIETGPVPEAAEEHCDEGI